MAALYTKAKGFMVQLSVPDKKIVIVTLLFFCGITLGTVLCIPLFAGTYKIIWGGGENPNPFASIQLAVAATALGAVVLWFVGKPWLSRSTKPNKEKSVENKLVQLQRRGAITIGGFLLFSAMCLTLFSLLSPILPDVIKAKDFVSLVVKWSAMLSLMAGSITLGLSLCVGIFEIWTWLISIGR